MSLYLRSRRVLWTLLALVTLALVHTLAGEGRLLLSVTGTVVLPYRYVLVVFGSAVAVASTTSPAPRLDATDCGPLARARALHLLAGACLGAACFALGTALTGGAVLVTLRSFTCWFCLCVVSASLLGRQLAWVVPLLVLVPLVRWGSREQVLAAWNWSEAPGASPQSAALTLCLLAAAGLALLRLRRQP